MNFDQRKVDKATLALLPLVTWEEHSNEWAWKRFDWNTIERLHAAGFIDDPRSKNKSVWLTEEGAKKSAELFTKLFGTHGN